MKIFSARETISETVLTLSNGDVKDAVVRGLKERALSEALDFIGHSDAATVEKLNESMDVETHYMERGLAWNIIASIAIPEHKPLFQREGPLKR